MTTLPRAITDLVGVFERLPGIGPKSATRLAFYLLNTPSSFVEELADDLRKMKQQIKVCQKCFGVSDQDICEVCSSTDRKQNLICVVERAVDVVSLENAGGYNGVYHVLNGVINPLNHVGPEDIRINELVDRLKRTEGDIEVILATNLTMEGEATALYIRKKVESELPDKARRVKLTRIGSGLPIGSDIEYVDMATLSRALEGRTQI